MICGMEIGLAIFGILALIRGRMTISKTKVLVGTPARLIGLLALTPLPAALGVGILYAIVLGADAEQAAQDNRLTLILIEAGIVIGVAVLVFALGAALAVTPAEAERRLRRDRDGDYDYDDEYDRPREDRDDHHEGGDYDDRNRRP